MTAKAQPQLSAVDVIETACSVCDQHAEAESGSNVQIHRAGNISDGPTLMLVGDSTGAVLRHNRATGIVTHSITRTLFVAAIMAVAIGGAAPRVNAQGKDKDQPKAAAQSAEKKDVNNGRGDPHQDAIST